MHAEPELEFTTSHITADIHSKYTPDRVTKILRALSGGNYRSTAAKYGGINERTLYQWIEKYPEFSEQVELAEAEAEIRKVARIEKASEKHWTADAWLLERKYPERWGRVDRVEIYQVQQQAKALAEELKAEGIEISESDIMKMRETLAKRATQPALPGAGQASRS